MDQLQDQSLTQPEVNPMQLVDWRSQLLNDSRQRMVGKIMDTLKRHLPFSGQEGLLELKKVVVRFEEKTYTAATSQHDYLRRISLKMLSMETKSQNNNINNSMATNTLGNGKNTTETGAIDTCDNVRNYSVERASLLEANESMLAEIQALKVKNEELEKSKCTHSPSLMSDIQSLVVFAVDKAKRVLRQKILDKVLTISKKHLAAASKSSDISYHKEVFESVCKSVDYSSTAQRQQSDLDARLGTERVQNFQI